MIEDESGVFHLLDVENKWIAEAEHKLDQEEWKKAQRTTNVTLPEEKDEKYQYRRDNTRRTQAQGGARYKWKQSNQIYLPSDTEYDYIEDERHQYKSLKPGTKYRVEKHYQQKFSNPSVRSSLARVREPFVEPSNPSARSSVTRDPFVGPSRQRISSDYLDGPFSPLQGDNFKQQRAYNPMLQFPLVKQSF